MIAVRKAHYAFASSGMAVVDTGNPYVVGCVRHYGPERPRVLANLSDYAQTLPASMLRMFGLGYAFRELTTGQSFTADNSYELGPYRFA